MPVGRQESRADNIVDIHQRPQRLRLLGAQKLHVEPKTARGRRLPLHLDPAVGVAGEAQPAIALPAGRVTSLRFELLV